MDIKSSTGGGRGSYLRKSKLDLLREERGSVSIIRIYEIKSHSTS